MRLNFLSIKRQTNWGAGSVLIAYLVRVPAVGGFLSAVWLATTALSGRPIDLSMNPMTAIITALLGWVGAIFIGTLWSFLFGISFAALAAIAAGLTHIGIRRFDLPLWLDVALISAAATGTQIAFLANIAIKYDPILPAALVGLVTALVAWSFRSRERENLQAHIG